VFSNLGWGESAFLLLFALLIFGPERLPRIAAQAGRAVRQMREMASGVTDDLRREMAVDDLDLRNEIRQLDPRRMLTEDDPGARSKAAAARATASAGGMAPSGALPVTDPAPFDPDTT
jgi:sec-independent protein translocase protein TatB